MLYICVWRNDPYMTLSLNLFDMHPALPWKPADDDPEEELRDLLTYECPYTGRKRCPPLLKENQSPSLPGCKVEVACHLFFCKQK